MSQAMRVGMYDVWGLAGQELSVREESAAVASGRLSLPSSLPVVSPFWLSPCGTFLQNTVKGHAQSIKQRVFKKAAEDMRTALVELVIGIAKVRECGSCREEEADLWHTLPFGSRCLRGWLTCGEVVSLCHIIHARLPPTEDQHHGGEGAAVDRGALQRLLDGPRGRRLLRGPQEADPARPLRHQPGDPGDLRGRGESVRLLLLTGCVQEATGRG